MVRNAPEFIRFTRDVFGAELIDTRRRENSEDVIHAEIAIGGDRIYVADSGYCGGEWISPSSAVEGACGRTSDGSKPIQMFVCVESADETCRKAVAAGGGVVMEPFDENGGRMGGITDPFENLWWVKSKKTRDDDEKRVR
jgi:PhnB protein